MKEIILNLASQTGFATLDWKNYIMILVAFVFMYLAIAKGFEPLLLVPISFGMFLVNMFPGIIEEGGLLHYFYKLDEWSILPSLIFMGVGAMTDFGPLIAYPPSFILGAAAQFGIYGAYFLLIRTRPVLEEDLQSISLTLSPYTYSLRSSNQSSGPYRSTQTHHPEC